MNEREKINVHATLVDIMLLISEGNPGAIREIEEIIDNDTISGFMTILGLDDMNIRGSQIWIGYKDHCEENLDKFITAIRTRDADMVTTINNEPGNTEIAVTSGASY